MLPFIYLRLKRTDETDYVRPFVDYVSEHMGDDPSRYEDALRRLTQLRNAARDVTKDMTGITILWKYRIQVESLDLRLPTVSIPFMWYDSFSGKANLETHLNYEKACILFNMAALFSQMGEKQDRDDDDGLKRAFHYFQYAGSLFSHICDKFSHAPTFDLRRNTLSYLKSFMLAEAQECFLAKGVKDQRKASILAKLAAQAAYMYLQLYEQLKEQKSWTHEERLVYHERLTKFRKSDAVLYPKTAHATREEKPWNKETDPEEETETLLFDVHWLLLMQNKFLYYTTLMLYYAAMDDISKNETGRAISRLQQVDVYAKEGQKVLDYDFEKSNPENRMHPMWQTMKHKMAGVLSLISEALKTASKDNDFIYHQTIPSHDALAAVERLDSTQVLTLAQMEHDIFTSQKGHASSLQEEKPKPYHVDDYFKDLMPLHVHEKASLYSEEKAQVLRNLTKDMEDSDVTLSVALESMEMKSVFNEMKKLAKFGKRPEDLLLMHLTSQHTPAKQILSPSILAMVERFSKKEREQPMELMLLETRQNLDSIEKLLRDSHDIFHKDRQEYEQGKVTYTIDWSQPPMTNVSSTLYQQLLEIENRFQYHLAGFSKLSSLEQDRPFLQALSSTNAFQSYVLGLGDSVNTQHHVSDLLGGTYDEDAIHRMEEILWDLVQLEQKRKSILDECKSLLLQDDISTLLLINQGKEEVVVQNELKKYLPFQNDLQDNLTHQEQFIASLSQDYQDFMSTQQHGTLSKSFTSLEQSLRTRLNNYEPQHDHLKLLLPTLKSLRDTIETLYKQLQTVFDQRCNERQTLAESLRSSLSQRQLRQLLSRYQDKPSSKKTTETSHLEEVTRQMKELDVDQPPYVQPMSSSQTSSSKPSSSLLD